MSEPIFEVIAAAVPRDRYRVACDLVALTKPRVLLMVLATTLIGYFVALSGAADYVRVAHLLLGTLLAAGGTLALNQYVERDIDARMERTKQRPVPAGRLQPLEALLFAGGLTSLGVGYLAVGVGVPAATLTAATTLLYIGVYTPLKRRTAWCLAVGAVPGALPPVTGWVAARGDLGPGAVVLFGILFLWQLPHTLAIAHLYASDYARAGVRVPSAVGSLGAKPEQAIVWSTLALVTVSLLPVPIGMSGAVYLATACALGLAFLGAGLAHASAASPISARRVLLASLLYLPLLLAVLALDMP
jgi:protoheme IX farnesyltransferase